MSNLHPYQSCKSNEGWIPIQVASETTVGLDYIVHVCPWNNPKESICECPGYHFGGSCKHQLIAWGAVCRWTEEEPEAQTEVQRKQKVCPRCGGQTKWEMELIDE